MQRQPQQHISLKHSAPGLAPGQPLNMNPYNAQSGYDQPADGTYDWNQQAGYVPGAEFQLSGQEDGSYLGAGQPLPASSSFLANGSQELVRRNANQQLAPMNSFMWQNATDATLDEEEELTRKALEARRDAEANKKGIPPFVQKLSSFLNDPKDSHLIRWSDDGLSFLILDEEAFAKDIIPHFWKHSNYASFVRQLNMYGFSKMVGLGDNSMKASENKTKQPSRYKSPYFRRGRPDLLWLIQKPVKQSSSTRKGQDVKHEEDTPPFQNTASIGNNVTASNRKVEVDEDTLKAIQKELADLRKQNHMITTVLNALRKQDVNIQSQALQFASEQQRMQQRHQQQVSSLQAIVSFLYNIFNNRLDGDARDTFDTMLRSLLPNNSGLVEVPEMPTTVANMNFNMGSGGTTATTKRRPLMLPAPGYDHSQSSTPFQFPQASNITELPNTPAPKLEPVTPQGLPDTPDVMSLLNPDNVANTPLFSDANADLNGSLGSTHTAAPQTASNQQTFAPPISSSSETKVPELRNSSLQPNRLALSPKNPPQNLASPPDAPPLTRTPSMTSQQSMDLIQKLQAEQEKKVLSLAQKLGPLSPTGEVPGLNDSDVQPQLDTDFDFDSWLNSTNDGNEFNFDASNFDFDPVDTTASSSAAQTDGLFGASNTNQNDLFGSGTAFTDFEASKSGKARTRVHSVSSQETGPLSPSSPATVETLEETPAVQEDVTSMPAVTEIPARKRRKRN